MFLFWFVLFCLYDVFVDLFCVFPIFESDTKNNMFGRGAKNKLWSEALLGCVSDDPYLFRTFVHVVQPAPWPGKSGETATGGCETAICT